MPPEFREKLLTHIRRTGRYPFLVVRQQPREVAHLIEQAAKSLALAAR